MKLVKLSGLILVALALVAVTASSASAAVATERAEWFVEEGAAQKTLENQTVLDAEIAEHTDPELGKRFTFFVKLGNIPVHFTAFKVECVGCVAENKAVTEKAGTVAFGAGKLKFSEIKVDEPAGCTVFDEAGVANQIITKPLFIHAHFMHEGKAYWQFIPQAGAAAAIAQFKLEGGGCEPIAGPRNITGALYGHMKAGTNVFKEKHELDFGPAIQETTGGGPLHAGANELKMTGTANFSLTKEGVRVKFAVK
jgi:hypothetical protein